MPRIDQDDSNGSGIIFQVESGTSGGLGAFILTNAHVVSGYGPVTVNVWNNVAWDFFTLNASVLDRDDELDVAVLWMCCDSRLLGSEMSFGSADIGAESLILGYPYGRLLSPSVTAGVISAHAIYTHTEQQIYLTDAPANPGNSGGPLILANGFEAGQVVGMVTAKHVDIAIEGQAIAIDINGIRDMVQELCDNRCRIPW